MGLLADAIAGLTTRLETISGLTVLAHPADATPKFPNAEIELGDGEYGIDISDDYEGTLTVTVRVEAARDTAGWAALELYLDPSGTQSIKAAVEGDGTLGGVVDWARVEDHTAPERDPDNATVFLADVSVRIYKGSN